MVNVYSGSVYVTATDDGINAANGDIAERSTQFSYNQYGGYVYINVTNGDGLDSNGSATFAGGVAEIYSPSQGDGDPIDTEYGTVFSGGTVLGVGNNAMQQSYSGTYVTFGSASGGMGGGFGGRFAPGMGGSGSVVSAGSTISIKDSSGNVIYTAQSTAPRAAGYVVFASPSLSSGGTYTLAAGSSSSNGSATTGTGSQGGFGGQPGGGNRGGNGGNDNSVSYGSSFSFLSELIQKIVDFFTRLFSFGA